MGSASGKLCTVFAIRSAAMRCSTATLLCALALISGCGGGGDSSPPPSAPTITTQPQSQTVTTGDTATFNVAEAGSAPLRYQWNKNGTAIAGATSSSYTTQAVTLADSGASFTVVVANAASQVTGSAAILTANADPEGIYSGMFTD